MLKYNLDVTVATPMKHYTPSSFAKQLPFYVESFAHYIAHSEYFTEREGVDNYYLVYTVSGCGSLKYRNKEYLIKAGSVFFIDCVEYQYYYTVSKEPWEFYYVHFNGMNVKPYFDYLFKDNFEIIQLEDTARIERFFNILFHSPMDFSQTFELIMSQNISDILTYLALLEHDSGDRFDVVTKYVMQNYREKISIDHLAKISNLSKYHFIRAFKQQNNETPYEFITRFRVNKAKQLLDATDYSVEAIASKVGFNDVNTFIRAFSKFMGQIPHQYRKH